MLGRYSAATHLSEPEMREPSIRTGTMARAGLPRVLMSSPQDEPALIGEPAASRYPIE